MEEPKPQGALTVVPSVGAVNRTPAETVSADIYHLAVQRVQERKSAQARKAAAQPDVEARRSVAREKAVNNPESYQEYVVQYLATARDAVAIGLSQLFVTDGDAKRTQVDANTMIDKMMELYVFSVLGQRVRLQKAPFERFVYQFRQLALEGYWEFAKQSLWALHTTLPYSREYIAFQNHRGRVAFWLDKVCSKTSLTDISLFELLNQLLSIIRDICSGIGEVKGDRLLAVNNEHKRLLQAAGPYLYKQLRRDGIANRLIDVRNVEEIKALVDQVADSLVMVPSVKEEKAPADDLPAIPKIGNLEKLKGVLLILMQRGAINGQVNRVLEKVLFNCSGEGAPVTVWKSNHYDHVFWGPFGRFFVRREVEKESAKVPNKVRSFLRMVEFALDLFKIGEILFKNGATQEQIDEGAIMIEMSRIYMERLAEFAVMLECELNELRGKEVKMVELDNHLASLESLRYTLQRPQEFARRFAQQEQIARQIADETAEVMKDG